MADRVNLKSFMNCLRTAVKCRDGWFAILRPFQQYLGHINERPRSSG